MITKNNNCEIMNDIHGIHVVCILNHEFLFVVYCYPFHSTHGSIDL